ncbi:hypothetical protein IJX73_02295 [bacterium]|nr:hypothetical protein [bacterium]MBQ9149739.1 hypothetical protein [bacterium]
MKKLILSLSILLSPIAFSYEEVPLLIDASTITVEYEKNNNSLINVDNMKKSDSIKKAKDEKIIEKPKLKLDTRQIHHQRTLDYMNNKNGTILPIF